MSNPDAKARRSRVKDARQIPAPDEARLRGNKKKRQPRPWKVIGPLFSDKEAVWHSAATEEAAQDYLDKLRRMFRAERPWRIEYRG